MSSPSNQSAVGPDGKLLDASQIQWFEDVDRTVPLAPTSGSSGGPNSSSTVSKVDHLLPDSLPIQFSNYLHQPLEQTTLFAIAKPAERAAGMRRRKPSTRLREAAEAEDARARGAAAKHRMSARSSRSASPRVRKVCRNFPLTSKSFAELYSALQDTVASARDSLSILTASRFWNTVPTASHRPHLMAMIFPASSMPVMMKTMTATKKTTRAPLHPSTNIFLVSVRPTKRYASYFIAMICNWHTSFLGCEGREEGPQARSSHGVHVRRRKQGHLHTLHVSRLLS
jgi:hypothetical protein